MGPDHRRSQSRGRTSPRALTSTAIQPASSSEAAPPKPLAGPAAGPSSPEGRERPAARPAARGRACARSAGVRRRRVGGGNRWPQRSGQGGAAVEQEARGRRGRRPLPARRAGSIAGTRALAVGTCGRRRLASARREQLGDLGRRRRHRRPGREGVRRRQRAEPLGEIGGQRRRRLRAARPAPHPTRARGCRRRTTTVAPEARGRPHPLPRVRHPAARGRVGRAARRR